MPTNSPHVLDYPLQTFAATPKVKNLLVDVKYTYSEIQSNVTHSGSEGSELGSVTVAHLTHIIII